jgi:F-type H+-transporting ATPase subunit delta
MTEPDAHSQVSSAMSPDSEAVAAEYAEALLSLLPDDGKALAMAEEMESLLALLDETDPGGALLATVSYVPREAVSFVGRVFGGRVSGLAESLLGVLAANGRLPLFRSVVAEYRDQLRDRKRQVEVIVRSAVELTDDELARLTESLRGRFEAEPLIECEVDPSLIAGMVVQVGDEVFDSSAAGDLARIRQALAKGRRDLAGRRRDQE